MFIINELEYAKKMYTDRIFLDKDMSALDLNILAKYLRHYNSLKDAGIYKALRDFCYESSTHYDEAIFERRLMRAVRSSKRFKLRTPVPVPIYKEEIEKLKLIEDDRRRRFAFSMLAIAKYCTLTNTKIAPSSYKIHQTTNQTTNQTNDTFKLYYCKPIEDALNLIKVKATKDDKVDMLYQLQHEGGIIDVKYNGIVQVICAVKEGSKFIDIAFMDCLNLYYDFIFTDSNIGFCERCTRPVKRISKERGRLLCRLCSQ